MTAMVLGHSNYLEPVFSFNVNSNMCFHMTFFNALCFPVRLRKGEQAAQEVASWSVFVSRGRSRRAKVYLVKKGSSSLLSGRGTIARSCWHPSRPRIQFTGQCPHLASSRGPHGCIVHACPHKCMQLLFTAKRCRACA